MVAGAHDHATKKAGEGKCGAMKASEGSCGVTMADLNKDGKVSKEEFTKHHDAMFEHMDTNKDGFIERSEMGMGEMAKKKTNKSK